MVQITNRMTLKTTILKETRNKVSCMILLVWNVKIWKTNLQQWLSNGLGVCSPGIYQQCLETLLVVATGNGEYRESSTRIQWAEPGDAARNPVKHGTVPCGNKHLPAPNSAEVEKSASTEMGKNQWLPLAEDRDKLTARNKGSFRRVIKMFCVLVRVVVMWA